MNNQNSQVPVEVNQNQPVLEPVPVKKKFNMPKLKFGKVGVSAKYRKLIIVFFIVLFLLIVLGILAPQLGKFVKKGGDNGAVETPVESPVPVPSGSPSPYVNDPDVIDIENNLKNIDEKYGNMSIREDDLRPPSLDFNVSF